MSKMSDMAATIEELRNAAVTITDVDPYERKVLGVTAMQKLLGKTRFEELLSPYMCS